MEQVNSRACSAGRDRLLPHTRLILGALAACAAMFAQPSADRLSEYELKAAYLLNFTRFIEWPDAAFEDSGSPFAICTLGEDPFQSTLDQAMNGESVNGRKVVLRRFKRAPERKSCQLLFIAKSERNVPQILGELGRGVLTVGEQPGFLAAGGIINLAFDGRHVTFDISQHAAANASLSVSARLLNVARSVQR